MADDDFVPDAPAGGDSKPPDTFVPDATPKISGAESFSAGAVHGLTAGWSDEATAAGQASGMPQFVSSLARVPVGAARLAYEHFTGQPGSASEAYNKALTDLAKQKQAMQEQHPIAYGAGELGGAGASMLVAPEASAAGWVPRMAQAAKIGAGYGAASGASQGLQDEGLPGAIKGAGVGAVEGAVGGAGGERLGAGLGKLGQVAYDYLGRPIASAVRGMVNPTQEAARRVAGGLYADVQAGKAGLTPQEFVSGVQSGEPVMLADLGGETTRALMRSAANTSPEGRAVLDNAIRERFADQSDRAGSTIRNLVSGGANAAKTKAQLEAEYDLERGGAYTTAYNAGDRPIWSPELERLTTAPTVAGALRGAVNRWKDFQVKDGFGGMNPPVKVTPDGQLQFTGGKGMLPYPNLQLWDYTLRNLNGMASAAKPTPLGGGNATDYGLYTGLAAQLRKALYKEVPEFEDAQGVAATKFGGDNAIQAGQRAVGDTKATATQLKLAMNGMKPAEREMFQESYADELARKMENVSDRQDITGRLLNSPQTRAKFAAVMGPQAANTMEAFVNREMIYDAARKALGNSTTVRQMMEAGLAGGVGSLALTGDPKQALEYGAMAAGAGAGAGASGLVRHGVLTGAKTMLGYVDRRTATRVAQLLASDDPTELMRGLQIASKNQRIADGLRDMATKGSAMFGAAKAPRVLPQFPSTIAAEPEQQPVPGIPAQQKYGGRVAQQRASGGKVGDSGHKGQVESKFDPKSIGAKQAKNKRWYLPDPHRPGRFLMVRVKNLSHSRPN